MYLSDKNILRQRLESLQNDASIHGLLLFGADKDKLPVSEMRAILEINDKALIGGVFPELIAEGERKEKGFVLIPIEESFEVLTFETQSENSIPFQLEKKLNSISTEKESVFCFCNALWNEKTFFIQELYNHLGPFVNYIGGGTGSLSFDSFPSVWANQCILEEGAVIGIIESQMKIGVSHGWHPITEPIKVTEAKGNTIISLNWEPAFEIYKSYIETHSKQDFDESNFFDIAKNYPLGLVKLDDEMVVRDPYSTEKGTLQVIDEVPQGEYIRIMNGNISSLIDGAKHAVEKSISSSETKTTTLSIDCISRVLFMQDEFKKELKVLNKNQKAHGVLSIGEIANQKDSVLEIFNKTVVVGQWKKKN